MFGEINGVIAPQALIGGSGTKVKPEVQDSFVKTDSVVRSDETFFSPVIRIDKENQTAIFQFRDTETGEVQKEYPSDSVRAYEAEQHKKAVVKEEAVKAEVEASEPQKAEPEPVQDFVV